MLHLSSVESEGRRRAALSLGIERREAPAGGASLAGVDVGLGEVQGKWHVLGLASLVTLAAAVVTLARLAGIASHPHA